MPLPFLANFMKIPEMQRHSIISFTTIIGITLLGYMTTMICSRLLGADLMGVYFLFLAYYGIFNTIGEGGFGSAAVKRISEGKDQNEYFSAFIVLHGILIIISTLILLTASPYLIDVSQYTLTPWIIAALIAAFFGGTVTYGVFAEGHIGVKNIASGVSECIRLLIQVLAVLAGFSLYGLCGGYIAGILITGILCLRYLSLRPVRFHWHHVSSLFSYGSWSFLVKAGSLVFAYANTILIGIFMNNSEVGIYRVASQLSGFSVLLCLAICAILPPKISSLSIQNQWDTIAKVVTRSITTSLVLSIPITLAGFILAEPLLNFFYGPEFDEGTLVCLILLIMQIIAVFVYILGVTLSGVNHPRLAFRATVFSISLNVVLDLILIPIIGISGAAIATLISYIVDLTLIYIFLSRYITIRFEVRPIAHIIVAALIMTLFIVIYRAYVPIDSLLLTVLPLLIGFVIFGFSLLKIDRGIRNELAGLVTTIGIPWPKWL